VGDPGVYLHPRTLSRLGRLELRAKLIVEGVMSGMHRSPYHGFSVEFAEHRQYVAGDDLRHLDWKVYGRSDKLYLKQYQQETNLDLVLLVDASGSMAFGTRRFEEASGTGRGRVAALAGEASSGGGEWTKFDHATATAAAVSFLALKQGDRVGLGMFADSLVDAIDRSSAMAQWRRIVGVLSGSPVERATDFGRVIDQTLGKLNNRCLVAIVSDFFVDPSVVRAGLARLKHRGHDALLLQVVDEAERTFAFGEEAPFEGLEGEGRLRVDPRAVREAYLAAFEGHSQALERAAKGFGFDVQRVVTHEWLGPTLAAFVSRRNAMLKRRKRG
jgi:uncharacterized protein (DUF58 family)